MSRRGRRRRTTTRIFYESTHKFVVWTKKKSGQLDPISDWGHTRHATAKLDLSESEATPAAVRRRRRETSEMASEMSRANNYCCECIASQGEWYQRTKQQEGKSSGRCSADTCPCVAARKTCDEHCESTRLVQKKRWWICLIYVGVI